MSNEHTDPKVIEVLDRLAAPLPPRTEPRTLQAMDAVRPTPTYRRRLVIAAVGISIAVLIALGFISLSSNPMPNAWARAAAKFARAKTAHYSGYIWKHGRQYEFETWIDGDNFSRYEERLNGELMVLRLREGNYEHWYHSPTELQLENARPETTDRPVSALVLDRPLMRERFYPSLAGEISDAFAADQDRIRYTLSVYLYDLPGLHYSEHFEQSNSGAKIDIIDAERQVKGGEWWASEDGLMRAHIEINSETADLLLVQFLSQQDGQWKLQYQAQAVELNAPIPPEAHNFEPPSGTKIVRDCWWETRLPKVIARATSKNSVFTVHAVDVNQQGDIFITLSQRFLKPTSVATLYEIPYVDPNVSLVNSSGKLYDSTGRGYGESYGVIRRGVLGTRFMTLRFRPKSRAADDPTLASSAPNKITLRVVTLKRQKTDQYPETDETLVLRDIPLPPRQQGDDLIAPKVIYAK